MSFKSQKKSNFKERSNELDTVKWNLLSSLWDHKSFGVTRPTILVSSCLMLISVPLRKNHFFFQEKPLSRSLQRGEDAQFDQVSYSLFKKNYLMLVYTFSLGLLLVLLYTSKWAIFDQLLLPWSACASIICVWLRTLHNWPVGCRMLCSAQHKSQRGCSAIDPAVLLWVRERKGVRSTYKKTVRM